MINIDDNRKIRTNGQNYQCCVRRNNNNRQIFLYKRNRIYDLQEKEKQRTYS